jgi:hypothetical protein
MLSAVGTSPTQAKTGLEWRTLQVPIPLPGGRVWAALVDGGIQHVDAPGVHMLGHLKHTVELVVQRRFCSRSGQRIITRSENDLVCIHHDYLYTPTLTQGECADLTITGTQTG